MGQKGSYKLRKVMQQDIELAFKEREEEKGCDEVLRVADLRDCSLILTFRQPEVS